MRIKIGIYMDEFRAKQQLLELLDGMGLTVNDFDERKNGRDFLFRNDYLQIARHSYNEGSRGYKNHFAICALDNVVDSPEIVDVVVRRSIIEQSNTLEMFKVLGLHRAGYDENLLRAESYRGVHIDLGQKEYIYATVKLAKVIHEAFGKEANK